MTEMREGVARLAVVLEAEEDVYRRLLDVLRREEEELVTLDAANLDGITGAKRALSEEAKLHRDARLELTRRLATSLGLGPVTPRLSALIEALGEEAGPLSELHARLAALLESTSALVDANARFAERSLVRVQDTLRLLGRAVPEVEGYGPGRASSRRVAGRMIRAAI